MYRTNVIRKLIFPITGGVITDLLVSKILSAMVFEDELVIHVICTEPQPETVPPKRFILTKVNCDICDYGQEYIATIQCVLGFLHVFSAWEASK